MSRSMRRELGALGMLGEVLKFPFSVFVYCVDMLSQTMQGIERRTDEGIDTMFRNLSPVSRHGDQDSNDSGESTNPGADHGAGTPLKEDRVMADTNLSDDRVKLVEYTIVTIKRDDEHALEHGSGQKIVTDNMSGEGFATWMIAQYLQQKEHEKISEPDKKYLRVCYNVLCRWTREPLEYEQKQLDALKGIKAAIEKKP